MAYNTTPNPGEYEIRACPHIMPGELPEGSLRVTLDRGTVLILCPECKMIITGHILKEIVEQAVVTQLKSAIDKAFSRP